MNTCELCTEVSAYLLHLCVLTACLIPLDVLCSQTMRQPKLFLCTSTIVINSKRGGPLKEYQSLCSIVYKCLSVLIPKIMEELSLSHWVEYQCNTSIETIMETI